MANDEKVINPLEMRVSRFQLIPSFFLLIVNLFVLNGVGLMPQTLTNSDLESCSVSTNESTFILNGIHNHPTCVHGKLSNSKLLQKTMEATAQCISKCKQMDLVWEPNPLTSLAS